MSSADSRTTSSSRLSQFGIYRSIDARTEEFLRLSRKRQIRQGCACAAVSTAITVTIVITVLLVYEYTMNMDSNPTLKSRMAAWHGIFNDTPPFEVKYSKSKVNIDPTTLKLLPLVLKALNQNRNIDKITDSANSAPVVETGKDNIEHVFKKKLFHGTKLKSSKAVHTMDFKPSPTVSYRHTFNNMDYYKKLRQAKDYNRMLNYFDKMINSNTLDTSASAANLDTSFSDEIVDKPSVESTLAQPVTEKENNLNHSSNTAKPRNLLNKTSSAPKNLTKSSIKSSRQRLKFIPLPKSVTDLNFGEFVKQKYIAMPLNRNQRLSDDIPQIEDSKYCKCSKKLAKLLSKLFIDIQNILPEIELYKSSCADVKNNKIIFPTTQLSLSTPSIPVKLTTRKVRLSQLPFVKQKMFTTLRPKLNLKPLKPSKVKVQDRTVKNITWLPVNYRLQSNTTNILKKLMTTTMKGYIEPTYTTPAFEEFITEPMNKAKNIKIRKNNTEHKLAKKHTTTTTTTEKLQRFADLDENYLYLSNLKQPLYKDDDVDASEGNREQLNIIVKSKEDISLHEHDNVYIFPLIEKIENRKGLQLQLDEQKQNTTSIIDWFNTFKNETKLKQHQTSDQQNKENDLLHYKLNTIEKPNNRLPEYKIEREKNIESKVNIDLFKEINEYQYDNISQPRKKILPSWPKETKQETNTNQFNKTVVTPSTTKAKVLPVINLLKLKKNFSKYENVKDKAKRENIVQQRNVASVLNPQKNYSHEAKNNDSNKSPKTFQTTTPIMVSNPKNKTKNLQRVPQAFFSKFADINNLLFQTKNISNITIYEKFNFGNNSNHDDNSSLAALQYDEFKFLNDEVQETEGLEAKLLKIDKYEAFKSERHYNADDSAHFLQSMVPVSRPVFLEIQRSDWKHDSNSNIDQDYGNGDTNFE